MAHENIDLSRATAFGVRWWSAAEDNETGLDVLDGPLDDAHLALALDTAEHDHVEMRGNRGICTHQVVVLDAEHDPIAVVESEIEGFDDDDDCDGNFEKLPVVKQSELHLAAGGELARDEFADIVESIWDGNRHVEFAATRSADFCTEDDTKRDGHVTWVFTTDEGGRAPTDMQVAAGWVEIDSFASDGFGNESGKFDINRRGDELVDFLKSCRVPAEFSEITGGRTGGYAASLIVEKSNEERAKTLCQHFVDADGEHTGDVEDSDHCADCPHCVAKIAAYNAE